MFFSSHVVNLILYGLSNSGVCYIITIRPEEIAPPAEPKAETAAPDNPFAGKVIVVTGKVEPYTRSEMNNIIASLGATAGSSVTGKTSYLVCGEKAGSKLDKARSLGITVLTPEEFFSMAQEQGGAA